MDNDDNYVDIASLGIDTSKPFANLKIIVESVNSDFEVEDIFHVCVPKGRLSKCSRQSERERDREREMC